MSIITKIFSKKDSIPEVEKSILEVPCPPIPTLTFSTDNFGKSNTPKKIEQIGNYLLIGATIGVSILGLPAAWAQVIPAGLPPLILPTIVVSVAKVLVGLGAIGKTVSKLFGVTLKQN